MKKFGLMFVALLVLTAASVVSPNIVEAWEPGEAPPGLDDTKEDHTSYIEHLDGLISAISASIETKEAQIEEYRNEIKRLNGLQEDQGQPVRPVFPGEGGTPDEDELAAYIAALAQWQIDFDEWMDSLDEEAAAIWQAYQDQIEAMKEKIAEVEKAIADLKTVLETAKSDKIAADDAKLDHCTTHG